MNFLQKAVAKILNRPTQKAAPTLHTFLFQSLALGREVLCDVYLPAGYRPKSARKYPLALFNDGQDLPRMGFAAMLEKLILEKKIPPIIILGIHASERRMREYGTARQADYKGRGDLAPQYARFVLEELLPHLRGQFRLSRRAEETAFAGFSLGGLSALDLAWVHPQVFGKVGAFSASLWWRSVAVQPDAPDADRIMHHIVQQTIKVNERQGFWFQTGTLDETEDRNHNGIIDSIDDTLDLIRALREKGIPGKNIRYLEIKDGRHEPATWGEAMPDFLKWAFVDK